MGIHFTTEIKRKDWEYILEHSGNANIFHSSRYFDIQKADGHGFAGAMCCDGELPVALIAATVNRSGYHKGMIEVGSKSGGWPLMTDTYEIKKDADAIKNKLAAYFYEKHLADAPFFFYPCFSMQSSIFENAAAWQCTKQYDHTVLLDLSAGKDALWAGLHQKCRNVVRYARKKEVTARIANEEAYLEGFYFFYKSLREHLNTAYMSYAEIRRRFLLLTEKDLADLWVAFSGDRPLAYAFIWKFFPYINFVYGSSDPESLSLKPNNLIQWELMSHYQALGYRTYNMWGVRNMNFSEDSQKGNDNKIEGYGKFKLSFGSELKEIIRFYRR